MNFPDLPAELRNRIYYFALVQDEPLQLISQVYCKTAPTFREPGLLSANRQIRSESLSIFYAQNVIQAKVEALGEDHALLVYAWLDGLSDKTLTMLQTIWLYDKGDTDKWVEWDVEYWARGASRRWLEQLCERVQGYARRGLSKNAIHVPTCKDGVGAWMPVLQLRSLVGKRRLDGLLCA